MSPTQELFRSLHSAFAPESDPVWFGALIVVALLAIGGLVFGRSWARKKARRQLLQEAAELGRDKRLKDADVAYAVALGDRAGISPVDLMKHLVAFERATARELASRASRPHAIRESTAARIGALRVALGFDVLPPDHWMSTTRELKPGDMLMAGATRLDVTEASEAAFTVELDAARAADLGTGPLNLEVIRPHDARYAITARILDSHVLRTEMGQATGRHRMVLAHDEQPRRLQQREFVRVRVARPMSFVPVDMAGGTHGLPSTGQIVDVSAGGMAFQAASPQPLHALHLCSFDLAEGMTFKDLATIVVDSVPLRAGQGFHIRVAFNALTRVDRERLAAAVATLEQQQERARKA
jgi:hypothetical protein